MLEEVHRAGVTVAQDDETMETVFTLNEEAENAEFRVSAVSGAEAVTAFRRWVKLRSEA